LAANNKNYYQQQVFDHWDLLNQLAEKRFPKRGREPSNLAEEGLLYVLNKLEENNWFRVRQYRGQASFRAFLAQTVRRLLEDFARQKFGRPRVPDEIKRLGPLWERVYKKLCWEQWSTREVIEELRTPGDQDRNPTMLQEIVAGIRGRIIDCGALAASKTERLHADFPESFDVEAMVESAAHTPSTEDWVVAEQRNRLFKSVAEWVIREQAAGSAATPDDSPLAIALRQLRDALPLIPEERLLLRLVFQEGLAVTEAGRRLGLNTNQTHGRLRRLLERIRSAWQDIGLDQMLKDLLEGGEMEF